LITGATGNVGREVVNLLLDDGVKVAAVTRDPARAALPDSAHVVTGDPSRPITLAPVLSDAEAILLSTRKRWRAEGTPPPPSIASRGSGSASTCGNASVLPRGAATQNAAWLERCAPFRIALPGTP
jgi:NAD(P)-dependent dehydrogenase (short-subunit alcohol dehydrogenase family)